LWTWGKGSIEESPEEGKEKPNFRHNEKYPTGTQSSLNGAGMVSFVGRFAYNVAPPQNCSKHNRDQTKRKKGKPKGKGMPVQA
jgi:hypothetical protein